MHSLLRTFVLGLFLVLPLAPQAFSQTCPVSAADVDIRVRTPSSSVDATDRREHVRISEGLRSALCIDASQVHSDGDDSPQLRVVVTEDTHAGAPSYPQSSGLFTVVGIDQSDDDLWVEIYSRRNSSDLNNGLRKLFPYLGSSGSLDTSKVAAEVYSIAPHATSYVDYLFFSVNVLATDTHYAEPNDSSRSFEEYLQLEDSKALALLVPHGDNIENYLDEQIGRFEVAASTYGVDTNIWEGRGRWGDEETHRRWHITSSDFNPVSFPGLQELFDAPDYATGRPFRWAVGLHGFTGRELTTHPDNVSPSDDNGAFYGVILGGRAHMETKCYLAMRLQDRYHERRDQVAITIVDRNSSGTVTLLEIPGLGGTIDGAGDLGGVDSENIINRLAPWSSGQMDRGAIHVELSKSLRYDEHYSAPYVSYPKSQLLEATISGLGRGIAQLDGYPPAAVGACEDLRDRNGL